MTSQDGPKTPPEAFQIVTQSLKKTVVRGKVPRGSPQRPPEGAQKAPRRLPEAPKEPLKRFRGAPKKLSKEEPPPKN